MPLPFLRFKREEARYVIGLNLDSNLDDSTAVLAKVSGVGLDIKHHVMARESIHDPLSDSTEDDGRSVFVRNSVHAIQRIMHRDYSNQAPVFCIGLVSSGRDTSDIQLFEAAAQIARDTGLAVVVVSPSKCQEWPSRLLDWMVLRETDVSRLIIHLDDVTSLVRLGSTSEWADCKVNYAGPAIGLLDQLCHQCMGRTDFSDNRGMLAVQGRRIESLEDFWRSFGHGDQTRPAEWQAQFVKKTIDLSASENWTLNDVLCTATHYVAQSPARFIAEQLSPPSFESTVVVGRGAGNGFLLRLLGEKFLEHGLQVSIGSVEHADAYSAVSAAVSATILSDLLATGDEELESLIREEIHGCFIPGAMPHWGELVEWMHRQNPAREGKAA